MGAWYTICDSGNQGTPGPRILASVFFSLPLLTHILIWKAREIKGDLAYAEPILQLSAAGLHRFYHIPQKVACMSPLSRPRLSES